MKALQCSKLCNTVLMRFRRVVRCFASAGLGACASNQLSQLRQNLHSASNACFYNTHNFLALSCNKVDNSKALHSCSKSASVVLVSYVFIYLRHMMSCKAPWLLLVEWHLVPPVRDNGVVVQY